MAATSSEGFRDRELGQIVHAIMVLEFLSTYVVGLFTRSNRRKLRFIWYCLTGFGFELNLTWAHNLLGWSYRRELELRLCFYGLFLKQVRVVPPTAPLLNLSLLEDSLFV
jgi:hypothetical protein